MNVITKLLLAATFTSTAISTAGAQPFNRLIGTQLDETARGIAATSDGGYVTAGSILFAGTTAANLDILVVKYAADGTVDWSITWGGIQDDIGYSVKQTRDGGYIVGAETQSAGALLNLASLKLDAGGNVMWSWVYEGDTSAEDVIHGRGAGVAVKEVSGGYVLTGRKVVSQTQQDGVIIRTSPVGSPIFNFRYSNPTQEQRSRLTFSDIRDEAAGTLVVTGTAQFTNAAGAPPQHDPILMRVASNGAPIIGTNFTFFTPNNAPESGTGDGLDLMENGDIIFDGRTDLGTAGSQNIHVFRTDPGFGMLWMGFQNRMGTAYRSIHQDRNNNIALGGWAGTFPAASDAMLMLLGPGGNPLVGRTYNFLPAALGVVPNFINAVDGYGLCGNVTLPAATGFGGIDIELIHTDNTGAVGCLDDRFEPRPARLPVQNPRWQPQSVSQAGTIWQANFRRITMRQDLICPVCPDCAADFNQDGGVDGSDVTAFFAAWAAAEPCADVNLDGGVDGADVGAFFVVWSAGGC